MKRRTALITALIVGVLLAVGIFGAGIAVAKNSQSYPPIIQKLVDKFGLDPAEVQKVFDEERDQRQQEMNTRFEERLTQAVENGKLTETQKEEIIAKRAEIQKKMDELRNADLAPEERGKKMKILREEMKDWAEKNDIDMQYLRWLGPGRGHGGGFGGPGSGPASCGGQGGFGGPCQNGTDQGQCQCNGSCQQ